MELREGILQAIFDAIDEIHQNSPDIRLERSPAAILVGSNSPLDSTTFLTFAISVEENLERILQIQVPVIDLIEEIPDTGWTVGDMANRIEKEVGATV